MKYPHYILTNYGGNKPVYDICYRYLSAEEAEVMGFADEYKINSPENVFFQGLDTLSDNSTSFYYLHGKFFIVDRFLRWQIGLPNLNDDQSRDFCVDVLKTIVKSIRRFSSKCNFVNRLRKKKYKQWYPYYVVWQFDGKGSFFLKIVNCRDAKKFGYEISPISTPDIQLRHINGFNSRGAAIAFCNFFAVTIYEKWLNGPFSGYCLFEKEWHDTSFDWSTFPFYKATPLKMFKEIAGADNWLDKLKYTALYLLSFPVLIILSPLLLLDFLFYYNAKELLITVPLLIISLFWMKSMFLDLAAATSLMHAVFVCSVCAVIAIAVLGFISFKLDAKERAVTGRETGEGKG